MLQGPKEEPRVAALFGDVPPLAADGVYPKTRVWGSKPENVHCSSAIGPLRIELRWGCEKSSEKTAVGSEVNFKYDPFGRRIYKSSYDEWKHQFESRSQDRTLVVAELLKYGRCGDP